MLVPLACLVLPTAACSGDDDGKDKDKAADEPTSVIPTDPKEARKLVARKATCDADVTTSGAYDAEWGGDATVRIGGKSVDDTGPNAVYTLLADEGNRLALYSPGPEFKGSISLSADGLSFSSDPADAESFDIDKRGKHAQVDTTLTSISGKELELVAEFTCGKAKAQ